MINKKLIYLFFLILPLLDLLTSITTRLYPLPISIGVIIKALFILIMIYYVIFKSSSKYRKKSLIYLTIIMIYSIFYLITKSNYLNINTFVTELNYLAKIMFYPILLVCFLCYFDDKKLSRIEIIKLLIINFLTYILCLFIPLITHTGFNSSNIGLNGTIGWFYSADEISIILIILFPFIYRLINSKKKKSIIIFFISILIISTIGTKESMLGIVITSVILFILSLFKKTNNKINKKFFISSLIIMIFSLIIFFNSSSLNNIKVSLGLKENNIVETDDKKHQQEINLIKEEINKLDKDLNKNFKIENNISYILSKITTDKDIYFEYTYKLYNKNFNINTLLFGIGYTNNEIYQSFAIEKLIEIDILDIFYHSGLIALIIVLLPFIYYAYLLFKKKKININIAYYTLMLLLIFSISCISGHTLMAPAVSIYIVIYFILAFNELGIIESKKYKIEKNKVTIYALHLNYGGVEKSICTKANMLSEFYNVEIISLYKLTDKPVFNLNKNIKVKYLTNNIKPNREEFKNAIKSKNIINIFKEGLYSIKVLHLKSTLITKSMIDCNSEIIISTRIDFTEKLIKNNEFNNIKIAEEHIYHNNKDKYLNRLNKVLKNIDYLMPSSDYLTNYYKELFTKYRYKIVTNIMPIETNNSLSILKNKNIITVGRLDKVKGYDDLIKLFSKISNNEWTLNIVGDGPEYNNLNNLIKELKLEDKVNLLGSKTTEELNELYKESSIYIMTSLEESFGLVLLEASSHGLPIIAYSSALGAKEILNNDLGILIDDRNETEMINKLTELMNDIKLRKIYQKRSLSIIEEHNNKITNSINFYKSIKKNDIYANLYKDNKNSFYKLIEQKLKNKEKTFIITANTEQYILSESDREINDILNNKNNLITPDGISIVKTSNYLGYNLKERITGVELAEYLLELANKKKYKVYLFGASVEVMEKLESVIAEKYPNINLVGSTNGYVKDKDSVMEYIKKTEPDIVMLALGIPLQEKLINKHINDFKKGIFIGVGGSFDVLSGSKKRAPKIFIKLNLEWLYRIICEPKRIIRFIKYNMKFIIRIFEDKNNR